MTKRVGFMFAGQGAQCVGMGKDLHDGSPAARALFTKADEVLGRDISRICFEGPEDRLTASANCQPAIYTMSMACLAALRERLDIVPVVCGGLSLGEFAALAAGGATDFETGLRLVSTRGALMDAACAATEGAMAAVIGAELSVVENACEQGGVDIANLNCPGQIVISGGRTKVEQTMKILSEAGVSRIMMLQVAGAFHSRLMASAAEAFAGILEQTAFSVPSCPIVQNVTGGKVADPDAIRENLRAQVTGSVHWEQCVRTMLDMGIEALVEFGPGKVLSGFMRRIDKSVPTANVGSLADVEPVAAILG